MVCTQQPDTVVGKQPPPGQSTLQHTISRFGVDLSVNPSPDNLFGCSIYPEWPLSNQQRRSYYWRQPYDVHFVRRLFEPTGAAGYTVKKQHFHPYVYLEHGGATDFPPELRVQRGLAQPFADIRPEDIAPVLANGALKALSSVLYRASGLQLGRHLSVGVTTGTKQADHPTHVITITVSLSPEAAGRLTSLRLARLFSTGSDVLYPDH